MTNEVCRRDIALVFRNCVAASDPSYRRAKGGMNR
jgi:hypothetical protein